MNLLTYIIITVLLVVAELIYFRIADKCNIIDKPNLRSSHSSIVLRGGGVIIPIAVAVWLFFKLSQSESLYNLASWVHVGYLPFAIGLLVVAIVSFVDDVRSLPDGVRLVIQFGATVLTLCQLALTNSSDITSWELAPYLASLPDWDFALLAIIALIVMVGATNIINFMDGINGITGGYALAVLIPLAVVNHFQFSFIDESFMVIAILALLVFCWFNFRPKGKAKCFAGDVGSISVGMILLFAIGCVVVYTGDATWFILILVYGVDGCMTIGHRIMLHEKLGEAHRKHAFQLMANELRMSHVVVSLIYMGIQLTVSAGFIWFCPNTVLAHWIYLLVVAVILCTAYVVFMKKYYHLHEEYLASQSNT